MKKQGQFVLVPVPEDRVLEVYALLGSQAPGPSRADDAVIEKAVQESSEDTWRFLHLLAASPGEWLSIEEVRQKLDLGVHNLASVLSTLPRRWRGYGESAPLPFEVEGQGSRKRYRMDPEVAEVVKMAPRPAQQPTWTRESFQAAMLDEDHGGGGPDAVEVSNDFIAWVEDHGGQLDFGEGATGPAYGKVPDPNSAGEWINVLSLNTAGDVGVRYTGLRGHPPYDDAALRDLTDRLSVIVGTPVRLTEKAFNVKLEFLLKPEVRRAFFGAFDDVARRLSQSS